MGIYKVLVTVSSHDALKEGRLAVSPFVNGPDGFETQVIVEADSDGEAILVATQVAAWRGMPTSAMLSDWPDTGPAPLRLRALWKWRRAVRRLTRWTKCAMVAP